MKRKPTYLPSLTTIGWSLRELARRTNYTEAKLRRLNKEGKIPLQLAVWVHSLQKWLEENPPPQAIQTKEPNDDR